MASEPVDFRVRPVGDIQPLCSRPDRDAVSRAEIADTGASAAKREIMPRDLERVRCQNASREHIVQVVNQMRLPAIYGHGEFTGAGGLMSYGVKVGEQFRRAAHYVDRILKGASPGDLPIEQPSAFEFSINTKTAASIGLSLPRELRLRANRLVE